MEDPEIVSSNSWPGDPKKWFRVTILVLVVISIMLIGAVASVSAVGATQISGIGYWPAAGEWDAPSNGQYFDYSYLITGDLEGCVYVTVDTAKCTPSAVYIESGTEFLDIVGGTQGAGTFKTFTWTSRSLL
jgi:hypothetical protein